MKHEEPIKLFMLRWQVSGYEDGEKWIESHKRAFESEESREVYRQKIKKNYGINYHPGREVLETATVWPTKTGVSQFFNVFGGF